MWSPTAKLLGNSSLLLFSVPVPKSLCFDRSRVLGLIPSTTSVGTVVSPFKPVTTLPITHVKFRLNSIPSPCFAHCELCRRVGKGMLFLHHRARSRDSYLRCSADHSSNLITYKGLTRLFLRYALGWPSFPPTADDGQTAAVHDWTNPRLRKAVYNRLRFLTNGCTGAPSVSRIFLQVKSQPSKNAPYSHATAPLLPWHLYSRYSPVILM